MSFRYTKYTKINRPIEEISWCLLGPVVDGEFPIDPEFSATCNKALSNQIHIIYISPYLLPLGPVQMVQSCQQSVFLLV